MKLKLFDKRHNPWKQARADHASGVWLKPVEKRAACKRSPRVRASLFHVDHGISRDPKETSGGGIGTGKAR